MQSGFKVMPVVIFQYEQIFGNADIFGDLASYQYEWDGEFPASHGSMFNIDFECPIVAIPHQRRQVVCQAFEIVNRAALEERQQQGVEATGERRPEGMQAHIRVTTDHGRPVTVNGVDVRGCNESQYWERQCDFVQVDGLGRAYQLHAGIQPCTRECRPVAFRGLCVGELDVIMAFYQFLLQRLRLAVPDEEEFTQTFGIIVKVFDNTAAWKGGISMYYAIANDEVKKIFSRLLFDGSARPDVEWEPSKGGDECLKHI